MKKYFSPFFKMLGFIILYYILYLILGGVLSNVFKLFTNNSLKYPSAISAIISSLILVLIFIKATKNTLSFISINFNKKTNSFLCGIQNGLIFAAVLVFLLLLSNQLKVSSHTIYNNGFYSSFISGIICSFIFVCAEEIIYRGCILHYFKKRYSLSGAIIISSFIYAVFSMFNTYASPLTVLNSFLFSCILSILVIKHDSIGHAIGAHFGWNIVLYSIFSLNNCGNRSIGIFNFNNKNFELLNGGSFGAEGGLVFSLFAVVLIFILFKHFKNDSIRCDAFKISKKNISVFAFLIVFALCYIAYDIKIWYPENRSFDTTPVKSVQKYENANNYSMDWTLDVSRKKLSGTETVDYINTSDDTLNEVYFHMYAAAFKKYNGNIKIENVKVNGKESTFNIEGSDKTLLRIPLESALTKGNRVELKMEYVVDIPERSYNGYADRLAYSNNAINLGNCFPIASVYENGGFDKHPYDEKGDAFYSETSNFSVTVSAPSDFTLAVTGTVDKTENSDNGNKKWFVTANSVRDFALVASNKLKVVEGNVNGTIIKSYAFNKFKAQKSLNISADAIKTYNKRFGEYPYGTCSVVETDLNGGMEYPTMIMLLSSAYDDINLGSLESQIMYGRPLGEYEFVLVHELAHQWWYGLIGDDEFNEAYVDEPLAQFSSLLYIKDKYGEKAFNTAYNRSIVTVYNLTKTSLRNTDYKRPLNKFTNDLEYNEVIYNGLPIKIKKYYDKIGDSKFNKVLQDTFKKYEFKILKGKDYPIPLE